MLSVASTAPVVNQAQFSAFEYRRGLLEACEQRGLAPRRLQLARDRPPPRRRDRPGVAERVGRTPAQVLLRWCLQRDVLVIPKSTHRERIEENGQLFDFTLSDEDMAALDGLDRTGGTDRARESKWW